MSVVCSFMLMLIQNPVPTYPQSDPDPSADPQADPNSDPDPDPRPFNCEYFEFNCEYFELID